MRLARDILFDVCTKHNLTISDVKGPSSVMELVRCRREIAAEMYRSGYGPAEIGRALNRCHSTAINLLKAKKRKRNSEYECNLNGKVRDEQV